MPHRRTVLASIPIIGGALTPGCVGFSGGVLGGQGNLPQRKGEIIKKYDKGIGEFNAGVNAWNEGIPAFNEAEYDQGVKSFREAIKRFEGAEKLFAESKDESQSVGEDDAAQLCDEARKRAQLMIEASMSAKEGCKAAADGADGDTINEHMNTAEELETQADQHEVADTETLDSALRE